MSTILMTVPAHFDGAHIRLDAEVALKPNTPLLVTILSEEMLTALAHDERPADWKSWEDDLRFTEKVLARIAEGAPTYSHEEVWDEITQREATGELSN